MELGKSRNGLFLQDKQRRITLGRVGFHQV